MRAVFVLVPALGALAAFAAFGTAAAPDAATFSESEIRQIVAHGPWPPPMRNDPSNRASGNKAAIAWGAELFRDPRLSGNGALACASCHQAEKSFTDGLPKARGLVAVDRNTPSVANTRLQRWYGWDGAGDSLWAQSLRPMVDAREMGSDVARVAAAVRGNADLASGYRQAFGAAPARRRGPAVDVAGRVQRLRNDRD
jgi:cytochrome c peroxidase